MASNKRKLYLDMDGVWVDFLNPASKILGRIVGQDITKDEWRILEDHSRFWLDLPLLPNYLRLWELSKKFDTYILTAPGGSTPERKLFCARQKRNIVKIIFQDLKILSLFFVTVRKSVNMR